jgi:hypothetical protein
MEGLYSIPDDSVLFVCDPGSRNILPYLDDRNHYLRLTKKEYHRRYQHKNAGNLNFEKKNKLTELEFFIKRRIRR